MDSNHFQAEGYSTQRAVLPPEEIETIKSQLPDLKDAAGSRNLLLNPFIRELSHDQRLQNIVANCLDKPGRPIRAILFDKTLQRNWALGWHQDNKIPVKERHEVEGYVSWSVKEGVLHCRPPITILENIVALRVAIDPNDETNGPLCVIPASHRHGFLTREQAKRLTQKDQIICLANPGDVVAMSPLTLHCSGKVTQPKRRRVLHIEYCTRNLAPPLDWAY